MFAGEFRVLWPQLISYSFFHRPVKSAINEKPEPNSTISKYKKKKRVKDGFAGVPSYVFSASRP